MVYDSAHSAEFFIKFPAFHSGVFFPFVVREKAVADIGRERLSRRKHTALHHQLGQTYAAQKRRFSVARPGHTYVFLSESRTGRNIQQRDIFLEQVILILFHVALR